MKKIITSSVAVFGMNFILPYLNPHHKEKFFSKEHLKHTCSDSLKIAPSLIASELLDLYGNPYITKNSVFQYGLTAFENAFFNVVLEMNVNPLCGAIESGVVKLYI